MTDWQMQPVAINTVITDAADTIEARLPKAPKVSWGRVADRLDDATAAELLAMAKAVI